MYNISKSGLDHIKRWEGFRNNAYLCPAKVWTIGYGNTRYLDGSRVNKGDFVTLSEGEELLKGILSKFEKGVNELIEKPISQELYDSLVSFAYNVGLGALSKSTLLKVVNNTPTDYDAIADQFVRWNRAGGRVMKGLKKRRNSEVYHFNPDYGKS